MTPSENAIVNYLSDCLLCPMGAKPLTRMREIRNEPNVPFITNTSTTDVFVESFEPPPKRTRVPTEVDARL